jgi:hypothetical protein
MVCNSVSAGSYVANAVMKSGGDTPGTSYSIGAYVFPPYNVTLLDTNPDTGTITIQSTAYANGIVISTIGSNTVTANPPNGKSFNNWIVSSANLSVASTSANPTTVTVEGSGSLTANYI